MNVLFIFCKDGRFSEYEIYFIETDIYQIDICLLDINPATKLVIPAAAERRAGIQKRPCDHWIPTFSGVTGGWILDDLFHCQVIYNERLTTDH